MHVNVVTVIYNKPNSICSHSPNPFGTHSVCVCFSGMGRCRLWGVPQFALCVRSERIHPSGRSGPQVRRWRQVEGERLVSEQPHHAAEDLAPKPSQIPAKTFKASSSIVTVTANPVAKQKPHPDLHLLAVPSRLCYILRLHGAFWQMFRFKKHPST